ncbi:MAG: MscL family protein [Ruminococcaceae bacterium]|nr:MscL family protein [Oscillospiraceae bacterium]MBO5039857.1 MscL family protein [Clostridia bacterium]
MNRYFGEFKKFISRGNVVDMAVGVIVGSAFSAIVTALSNNVLKPIVNYLLAVIFDAESLTELYTFLKKAYIDVVNDEGIIIGQEIDLAQSIYIDWGALINAILSFFLIAIVLFTIVKLINKFREEQKEFAEVIAKNTFNRKERKELRENGIKPRDRKRALKYFEEKEAKAAEAAKLEAEEKARIERELNPTTEDLLKKILDVLQNK